MLLMFQIVICFYCFWGNQIEKVDTKAKFCIILFVMINALIWCNFENNQGDSFWANTIFPIRYPHGQDLGFFLKSLKLQFLWLSNFTILCYGHFPIINGLKLIVFSKWHKAENKNHVKLLLKVLVSYISVLHNFGFGKVSPAKQL